MLGILLAVVDAFLKKRAFSSVLKMRRLGNVLGNSPKTELLMSAGARIGPQVSDLNT